MRTMAERFKRAIDVTLPTDMIEDASIISSLIKWSGQVSKDYVIDSEQGYQLMMLKSGYQISGFSEKSLRREWDGILYWMNNSALFLSWQWLSFASVVLENDKIFVVIRMTVRPEYL